MIYENVISLICSNSQIEWFDKYQTIIVSVFSMIVSSLITWRIFVVKNRIEEKRELKNKWDDYVKAEEVKRFIAFAYYIEKEGNYHKLTGEFLREDFDGISSRFADELAAFETHIQAIDISIETENIKSEAYIKDAHSSMKIALKYFLENPSFSEKAKKLEKELGDKLKNPFFKFAKVL